MAPVITPDFSSVTMQDLHDDKLNPFAVELLVESYAGPRRCGTELPKPVHFIWRGVRVQLSVMDQQDVLSPGGR